MFRAACLIVILFSLGSLGCEPKISPTIKVTETKDALTVSQTRPATPPIGR